MKINLTEHSLYEFRRHRKGRGDILRQIAAFFSKNPILVTAISYTLPRGGASPTLRGRTYYLASSSWKVSGAFLVLDFQGDEYTAVTTLSGREFRRDVSRNLIKEIEEHSVSEFFLKHHTKIVKFDKVN